MRTAGVCEQTSDRLEKDVDLEKKQIAGKKYYYRVKAKSVISPEQAQKIEPVKNKDILTLITCTPVGIHTKRLVVDCERCEKIQKEKNSYASQRKYVWTGIFVIILIISFKGQRYRKSHS